MDEIPIQHQKILERATSPAMGKYVWFLLQPSMGYSFSSIHGTLYSYIAVQAAYLATYFNRVYWNSSYLRVTSGLEEDASTNYVKVAKAVGNMVDRGVKVVPVDINQSKYMFEPSEENNSIYYGFKALDGVNGEVIQQIIANRPYTSFQDFQEKVNVNKTVTLSLIKSGAFDQFGERKDIMEEYLRQVSEPKKRITLQNFKGLADVGQIPDCLEFQKRLFRFNKCLKAKKKVGDYYCINYQYYDFYEQFFDTDLLELREGTTMIAVKTWQKLYTKGMEPAKKYFQENQEKILKAYNDTLFQEQWDKYCGNGSYSAWEMDSMGYYYHNHELAHINRGAYGIKRYCDLPREPEVEYTFRRNGRDIPIFKTCRICGTVIGKDNAKASINVLTPESGVVTVSMNREYFALYNRRISDTINGESKVMEQGWFQRGTLVVLNGVRNGDSFRLRSYKKTPSHQLYIIDQVNEDGSIVMRHTRYGEKEEQ